ncbi:hypothetical protein D0Y65_053174 [Glycine soja]|uniref:Uncharacterized protein n=1 Tax=Glycine soja TaxID=3848 RepID=A0A445F134_GLYSO|nr:hypothetical protein D0Y65_053174 [Glycine soja]
MALVPGGIQFAVVGLCSGPMLYSLFCNWDIKDIKGVQLWTFFIQLYLLIFLYTQLFLSPNY